MAAQGGLIMSKWALLVLGLTVLAHLEFVAHSIFQCSDALPKLTPCVGFVLGGESKPTDECCTGVRELDKMTAKHEDRKALCECAKQVAPTIPIDFDKANVLPKLCGVTLNFTISPDMDCKKV